MPICILNDLLGDCLQTEIVSALIIPLLFSPYNISDKELKLGVQVTAMPFFGCCYSFTNTGIIFSPQFI